MKQITIFAVLFLMITSFCIGQNKTLAKPKSTAQNQIKQYWFVMLIAGTNRTQDSATAAKIQEGHMANINRLYYEGKLKVAGPFGDEGNWKGIFIFNCDTKEEVETILLTDPAIAAGRLTGLNPLVQAMPFRARL